MPQSQNMAGILSMQIKTAFVILPGISAAMLTPTMMGYVIIVAPARTGVPTISQTQTMIVFVTIILAREWAKNVVSGADAISIIGGNIMRSEQEVNRAIEQYSDMIRRLCMIHLKNYADTEDIFQTVFLKYVLSSVSFESKEHEKAWFIRVTINACKDLLKSFIRSRTISLDERIEQPSEMSVDDRDVLEAVLSLPQKYKDVVYLHYYEDYTAPQISRILGKNVNTIYTLITRSKRLLREKLGGDGYE